MKKKLPIYSGSGWQIWPDKVEQLPYKTTVVGLAKNAGFGLKTNLATTYLPIYSLIFKLSINGKDNELPVYQHHQIWLKETECQQVRLVFGQRTPPQTEATHKPGLPQHLHIIIDLTPVFSAIQAGLNPQEAPTASQNLKTDMEEYAHTTADADKMLPLPHSIPLANNYTLNIEGDTHTGADIKLYLAGQPPLLSWDFANLPNLPKYRFVPIIETPHLYELHLSIADFLEEKQIFIKPSKVNLPRLTHDFPLATALFGLAIQEIKQNLNAQKQFRAGKNWEGVWTRDLAYSLIMGLSHWYPKETANSLRAKIKNDKALQDTGTGGAWPCSTDAVLWVWAAYQHYLATGDTGWLHTCYHVSTQTLATAEAVAQDTPTRLFKGETSFLDWREQSYPAWLTPAGIAQSIGLSTNLAYLAAYQATAQMAKLLGHASESQLYQAKHTSLKTAIEQHFPNLEAYSYGTPYPVLADSQDTLALALILLNQNKENLDFDITQKSIDNLVFGEYGFACFSPQIPHVGTYHNNGIWPFVQSLVALGAANTHHPARLKIVEYVAATLFRAGGLFVSNKENFNAQTGHADHTLLNSDAQLWSAAGMCSLFLQVFAGLKLEIDHFCFQPLLPKSFASPTPLILENIALRQTKIHLKVQGWGRLESILVNGKKIDNHIKYEWLEEQKTPVEFVLILDNKNVGDSDLVIFSPVLFRLDTPKPVRKGNIICWPSIAGVGEYDIRINGIIAAKTKDTAYFVGPAGAAQHIQIRANIPHEQASQSHSFWSKHIIFCPPNGFLTQNIDQNCKETILFTLNMYQSGAWLLYFVFSNGNGPTNTGDTCAIRTLTHNQTALDTKIVLPHTGGWQVFEHSAPIKIEFQAGQNEFELSQTHQDQNMNRVINYAYIKCIELYKL